MVTLLWRSVATVREQVLQGDGHTEQRLLRVGDAGGEVAVRGIGLGQGVRGIVAHEGMDLAVHFGEMVETGLERLAGGTLAAGELGGQAGDGEMAEHRTRGVGQQRRGGKSLWRPIDGEPEEESQRCSMNSSQVRPMSLAI